MSDLKKRQYAQNPELKAKVKKTLVTDYWKGKKRSESTKAKISKTKLGVLNDSCWKGGRTIDKQTGYVRIRERGKWKTYKYEHRKVMEEFLGRKLLRFEIVHHINGNTQDNCIENLCLLNDEKDHLRFHDSLKQRDNLGRFI